MGRQVMPITPQEAAEKKLGRIPDFVIESVNELLVENYSQNSKEAVLLQEEIIERIQSKAAVSRSEIFDKDWLDFEKIYENAGWNVDYDKPAYCESYEPKFTFTKKK